MYVQKKRLTEEFLRINNDTVVAYCCESYKTTKKNLAKNASISPACFFRVFRLVLHMTHFGWYTPKLGFKRAVPRDPWMCFEYSWVHSSEIDFDSRKNRTPYPVYLMAVICFCVFFITVFGGELHAHDTRGIYVRTSPVRYGRGS